MVFEFGKYILDIDVEKTRAFYLGAARITDGCTCQGCRNYEKWASSLSGASRAIFEGMGILPEKSPEVYVNCPNSDGSLFYGGFYHLSGTIMQGSEPWKEISVNISALDEDPFFPLTPGFRAAFTENVALLEKDFPAPVIQMEILANIPFVLPEKCTY